MDSTLAGRRRTLPRAGLEHGYRKSRRKWEPVKNDMPPIKKIKPIPPLVKRDEAVDAFKILLFEWKYKEITKNANISLEDQQKFNVKFSELKNDFERKYKGSYSSVIYYFRNFSVTANISPTNFLNAMSGKSDTDFELIPAGISPKNLSPDAVFKYYAGLVKQSDMEPVKFGRYYGFKGYYYSVEGHYTEEQIRLLLLEDFDKERSHFEKLKTRFDETWSNESNYERPRIPESVRIEVWRRDGGKCARCGSREKLEYDHIVPISKGGSNTARNIELLCERHNRSKSNNVV